MAIPDRDNLHGLEQQWATVERPMNQNAIENVDSLARKTIIAVEKRVQILEAYGTEGANLSEDIKALADSVERIAGICENAIEPMTQEQAALAGRLLQMRDQLEVLARHSHHVYHDIVLAEEELQADYDHNYTHLRYPEAYQHEAEKCFARFQRAEDPKVKQFYGDWACKYYELAANAFIKKGDPASITQAAQIRKLLASHPDLFRGSKLNRALAEDINHPAHMQHALLREINLGIGLINVGGVAVKRQAIHMTRIPLDGANKTVIDFKMSYPHADQARETMRLLAQNPSYRRAMESGLNDKISIFEESFMYYHKDPETQTFTSRPSMDNQPGALKMGNAMVVEIAGKGRVEIGSSKEYASLHNKVRIVLEEGATQADLQKLLAICGLSQIYTDATTQDRQRLEFNFVLHQLYPRFMARFDKNADFFTRPMQSILNELERETPGSAKKVLDALQRVERYTIMPGVEGMKIRGIGQEITKEGARGFVSGIGHGMSVKKASKVVASIIQSGAFASQVRYDQGLLLGGACSDRDHMRNGADSVFTRVVTQNTIDRKIKIKETPFTGIYQLCYHVDIADQQHYCHSSGYFGCRNPNDPHFGHKYMTRPNPSEHTRNNQKNWNNLNEAMYKHRLESGYVQHTSYQDPRRQLLTVILDVTPNFFEGQDSIPERLAYITELGKSEAGREQLRQALGPHRARIEKQFSLEEHWTVDPKEQLMEDLFAIGSHSMGGEPLDDAIQESDVFSEKMFEKCHEKEEVRQVVREDEEKE